MAGPQPSPRRRAVLRGAAGLALAPLAWTGCAAPQAVPTRPRVVVVGGGFGGATAAKFVRQLSAGRVDVVLVEPREALVSCPLSNLVVGGSIGIGALTRSFDALQARHGVRWVRDRAVGIDPVRHRVRLAGGATLDYDRLVLSPGVEMIWDRVAGLREAGADGRILQAWHAGAETLALRRQLEAMPDGGVFAIGIPEAPFRCPPAPYERACLVADYFRAAKPRSKILILDANEDVASEPALFHRVWAEHYKGMIEYRPQHVGTAVDAATLTLKFEIQDDVRADVLNVLPPMRAGAIAVESGLARSNARWCQVEFPGFESVDAPAIHVVGDSIQIAPLMPKSATMAHSQAKVAAAAVVAALTGSAVDAAPTLANACYSFTDPRHAIHIAGTHAFVAAERTYKLVGGSFERSAAPGEEDARLAWQWARAIWDETLG